MSPAPSRTWPRPLSRAALLLALLALHGAVVVLFEQLSPRLSRARTAAPSEFQWLDLAPPRAPPPNKSGDARRSAGAPARSKPPPADTVPDQRSDSPATPPIDWSAEAAAVARRLSELNAARAPRSLGAVPEHPSMGPPLGPPSFGWDDKHIHPTFPVEGGGLGVWMGDRCALIVAPLPFMACGVGRKPPARGDLFDHMRDPPGDLRAPPLGKERN